MAFGSNASFSAEVRVGSLSPVHLRFSSKLSLVLMDLFSLQGHAACLATGQTRSISSLQKISPLASSFCVFPRRFALAAAFLGSWYCGKRAEDGW